MLLETTNIYTLSCPISGLVRYVGKSNNPKQRFSRHISEQAVTKNGNFIAEFETITSAATKFNLKVPGISAVCREVKKTAGGFIWKYKTD